MKLNRTAIQRMIDTGALNVGGRRTAGSGGGGGGGGVSATWVDENYISKAFFNQLFTIHSDTVTTEDPQGTVIEPNDVESTVASIQAMVGLWTEEFLSALGLNSGGGGGGGVTLNEPLASINSENLGTPSNGKTLVYQNNRWQYGSISAGGVTSITAGTGLSGGTITTSGTIAINSTYQTYITHGESAYNSLDNYLLKTAGVTAIVVGTGTNANKIGVTINGGSTGFITVPYATSADEAAKAAQLKTSRKIWGQDFNGTADVKGTISNASGLEFTNLASGASHGGYIDFHYEGDTSDYTSRIIEDANGKLKINNTIWAALSGNVGIGTSAVSGSIKLIVDGYTKTSRLYLTDSVYLEFDSQSSGVHLVGAGFYSDSYISALGVNSGGGGGGGATLNEPLDGINNSGLGAPSPGTQTGAAIVFNGTNWTYSHSQGIVANYFDSIGYIRAVNNITSTSGNLQITSGRAAIGGAVNTSYKLYVAGNIRSNSMVLGDDATVGTVTCTTIKTLSSRGLSVQTSGNAPCYTNVAWSTSSDMRLKRVIEDITTDISSIAKAPIFNFEWIKGGNKALGTSAQYWQNIFPYAVLGDQNNYLSMDYGGVALAAAVITARRVVELEKRIKELESKLQ